MQFDFGAYKKKNCSECGGLLSIRDLTTYRNKTFCNQCLVNIKEKEKKKKEERKHVDVVSSSIPINRRNISDMSPIESLLKEQVTLLKELVTLQKTVPDKIQEIVEVKTSNLISSNLKDVTDPNEVWDLIQKFIRGQMPNDSLQSSKDHRTFRIDDFSNKMLIRWNINIDRDLIIQVKESYEEQGQLVPTEIRGPARRYVLKEFEQQYKNKFTRRDIEILTWLSSLDDDSFSSTELGKALFPTKNDTTKFDRKGLQTKLRKLHTINGKPLFQEIPTKGKTQRKHFLIFKKNIKELLDIIIK